MPIAISTLVLIVTGGIVVAAQYVGRRNSPFR